jgi:hypothetical protein
MQKFFNGLRPYDEFEMLEALGIIAASPVRIMPCNGYRFPKR